MAKSEPAGALAPNFFERTMAAIAPKFARQSYATRVAFYQTGQYQGARRNKTSLKAWTPFGGSADTDTLGDLYELRSRSRDLARNAPIARGARNTSRVNVVGSGLRMRSEPKRDLLNMTEDEAEAWGAKTEALFELWASSKLCDYALGQNFYELQSLAFLAAFDSGDTFIVRRFREDSNAIAGLCLQLLEADQCSTPLDRQGQVDMRDGIRIDQETSAPVAYYFSNRHPGDTYASAALIPEDWTGVTATGAGTGQSLVLHLFDRDRIGLTRGVPFLAPVIDDLKQLDRYAEAELMAAVVSAFFTVFIKNTNKGGGDAVGFSAVPQPIPGHYGPPLPKGEVALGSGSVVELAPDEDVTTANPNRPNANFDPFFQAVVRKIGVALGIPFELLIMHFTSSYSASRAAIEMAYQFFMDRRKWLERGFCQPVYEWWLFEMVARGVISAPGFFEDPIKRAAYSGAKWIGPARIVLDPVKEANAELEWIEMGVKTLEEVTTNQTGGNWKANQEQRGREVKLRTSLKLEEGIQDMPLKTPGGLVSATGTSPAQEKQGTAPAPSQGPSK